MKIEHKFLPEPGKFWNSSKHKQDTPYLKIDGNQMATIDICSMSTTPVPMPSGFSFFNDSSILFKRHAQWNSPSLAGYASDSVSSPSPPLPLDTPWPCSHNIAHPAELAKHLFFGIEIEVDCLHCLDGTVLARLINQTYFPTAQTLSTKHQQWQCDWDSSIPQGSEFISPILQLTHLASLDTMVQCLQQSCALETEHTGIHIHLNATPMTIKHALRFLHLTYNIEPELFRMFATHTNRMQIFCCPIEQMAHFHTTNKPTLDDFLDPHLFSLMLAKLGDVANEPALYSRKLLQFLRNNLSLSYISRFQGINFTNLFPHDCEDANSNVKTIELRYFNTILDKDIVLGMVHFAVHLQATALSEKSLGWLSEIYSLSSHHDVADRILRGIEFPCVQHQKFYDWIHFNIALQSIPSMPLSIEQEQSIVQSKHHIINTPLDQDHESLIKP